MYNKTKHYIYTLQYNRIYPFLNDERTFSYLFISQKIVVMPEKWKTSIL